MNNKFKTLIIFIFVIFTSYILLYKNESKVLYQNDAEKFAYYFYENYLENIYLKKPDQTHIGFSLGSKGYYELDSQTYDKFLLESDFFTKSFIEEEHKKIDFCNNSLKSVKVEEVKVSGAHPADFVDNGSCGFLFYFTWVGGQGESLNHVSVLKSTIKENNATVWMALGYKESNRKDSYDFSYPIVYLVKESNSWKIDKIELSERNN